MNKKINENDLSIDELKELVDDVIEWEGKKIKKRVGKKQILRVGKKRNRKKMLRRS